MTTPTPNADSGTEYPDDVSDEPSTAPVYRTLGTVYLERPNQRLYEQVQSWAGAWLDALPSRSGDVAAALERIHGAESTDVETLKPAFTRLFRGISEHYSVEPPYESFYRDGQLYGSTALEVQRGYRAAGFEVVTDERNELPDHLGIELQFLGELCAMADGDDGLPADRAEDAIWWLLDEHLTEWLPRFRRRVHEADPPAFYAGVVDLTIVVVEQHHDRLAATRRDQW